MQSYTDLMPRGHQRSRWRGLLQRPQAAAISAHGCESDALAEKFEVAMMRRGEMPKPMGTRGVSDKYLI
jgi:hypothetical protein